jgi:hypothetical protein
MFFFLIKDRNNENDFFIWKSNTLINENQVPFDLVSILKQGRYLINTNQEPNSYIYLWILNDNSCFKHYKYNLNAKANFSVSFSLKDFYENKYSRSKKIMYAYKDTNGESKASFDLKVLKNDFNVNSLTISKEQFQLILSILTESTGQLCESLKVSNDFYFAIV